MPASGWACCRWSSSSPSGQVVYGHGRLSGLLFQQERRDFSRVSKKAKCTLALLRAMAEVLSECKFAITTSGMLTLLPKMADKDDLIVRIGGASGPFVVKRAPPGGDLPIDRAVLCPWDHVQRDTLRLATQDNLVVCIKWKFIVGPTVICKCSFIVIYTTEFREGLIRTLL